MVQIASKNFFSNSDLFSAGVITLVFPMSLPITVLVFFLAMKAGKATASEEKKKDYERFEELTSGGMVGTLAVTEAVVGQIKQKKES